jgi:serine O-acetyltransferase
MFLKPNYYWLYWKFRREQIKYGFIIWPNCFGPGLSIAHPGPIIVNSAARIGKNCRIHECVNIGTEAGYGHKVPHIGNNVFIGPGAKIFGEITIADGIAIGANSVVNKSFLEPNITIAGVPAKKVSGKGSRDLLIDATEKIKKGSI